VRNVTQLEAEEIPVNYEGLDGFLPMPPNTDVFPDQGEIGSCVGWDFMNVMETAYNLVDKKFDELSAAWMYQKSRDYSDPQITDADGEGSTNMGACKALNHVGITTRDLCPEDITAPFKFSPLPEAEKMATNYTIDSYWDINPNIMDLEAAIYGITHPMPYTMPDGTPGKTAIASAFPVYDSFMESIKNGGVVPSPKPTDELQGGHSSMLCGWKEIDGKKHLKNMGSWGPDVADKGFFWIPADYPFYSGDFKLVHLGPATVDPNPPPTPEPSTCPVAQAWIYPYNALNGLKGGKTRLHATVP
jgi:hypothetical protein